MKGDGMFPQTELRLGDVMDMICDHPAARQAAFFANVALGAGQAGIVVDILRTQRSEWSNEIVERLIQVIEAQSDQPTTLVVSMEAFSVPVQLPIMAFVGQEVILAAAAVRLGRLLFLAFLSNRSAAWGIELSGEDTIEKIADKVNEAIGIVAHTRGISMDDVESLLALEEV